MNQVERVNSSVQFSRSVMSDSLRPHESHHARPPCPSPTPQGGKRRSQVGENDKPFFFYFALSSVRFSSVAQLCLTLCDPMDWSTLGLPDHHQLPESTQTHVHWVSNAIQPSHTLSSPSPPALDLSQHQGLFQWVSSSHQVAKVSQSLLKEVSTFWLVVLSILWE